MKMKRIIAFCAAALMTASVTAQELPKPSPHAKVEQMVGLTTITIDYSRPAVKERTIWGDLVPYGEVWRVGANACTKVTTTHDLTFGKQVLKAGTYALFITPSADSEWSVVLNTDTEQWGAGNYDETKNVITVKTHPIENSYNESMLIEVNNITNSSAVIAVKWEKIRIEIPFTVNTNDIAQKNIQDAIKKGEDLDQVYYTAAAYHYNNLKDEKTALDYLTKSNGVKKNHRAYYLQAVIAHDKGDTKKAVELAEEAVKLAEAAESKGWADYLKGKVEEWKK